MVNYQWFKTWWHAKFDKAMKVSGLSERSRKVYTRAMRLLVEHLDKTPDLLTEEELLDYFIYRQEESGWSPATMRICHAGIKFFYHHVLKKDWHLLHLAKAKREKRLPAVLSREEVKRIKAKVTTIHNYAYLMTVYTCGLRLQEGLYLGVSDIDGARKMIHIHRGKGAKDRYVPLPESTYALLCRYWLTHRNPRLIFPATGRGMQKAPTSQEPHREIRSFCRSHQRLAYETLFSAAAGAIKKLARDPRHIGTDLLGFTRVLHTWGRQLQYHPHVHFIVAAGGLSKNKDQWLLTGNTFYLPVRALAKIFKARFKAVMARDDMLSRIDPEVWRITWNVNCQAVGNAEASLKYLAPYIFRVAISDSRIASVEGGRSHSPTVTRRVIA